MNTHLERVIGVYRGSSGDATRALYAELNALSVAGQIAVNVFRAMKTSERAKVYRRRAHKNASYDTKQWSIDNLAKILGEHAAAVEIVWGWGVDDKQEYHKHVLYVELPTGQVSFHTDKRGDGPDYPGRWDEMRGQGADRICRWCARLLGHD